MAAQAPRASPQQHGPPPSPEALARAAAATLRASAARVVLVASQAALARAAARARVVAARVAQAAQARCKYVNGNSRGIRARASLRCRARRVRKLCRPMHGTLHSI